MSSASPSGTPRRGRSIRFDRVAGAALADATAVVRGLLPAGRKVGWEWVCLNPRRPDRHAGSFKVNLSTGKWGDFATGDAGGDLISLAAFVTGLSQRDAAIRLADSLAVDPFD